MANYFQGKGNTLFSSVQLVLVTIAAFSLFSGCGGDEKFKISGTVTSGGVALPGVTVTLSGEASKQTQTDKDGNYFFDDLSEGRFTVAPSFSGYMFTPPYRTVWIYGLNGVGFNFSGSAEVRMSAKTHTVVLKDDGTVWAWGSNGRGQLGDGTTTDRTSPVQVSGLSGVSAVAAGSEYTVVLKDDGIYLLCKGLCS